MINSLTLRVIVACIAFLGISSCKHKPSLNNYNWFLGEWEVQKDGKKIYEVWKPLTDTLYEGFNYSVNSAADTLLKEHLWLESRDGKVILSAVIFGFNNDKRIFYTLTKKNIKTARFENEKNNFPTTIEYHRSGTHFLEVRLKGQDNTTESIKMHKIED